MGAFAHYPREVARFAQQDSWERTAAAINGPIDELRRLAAEEGRDPSQLGMILRVYPTAEGSVEQIVEAIVGADREPVWTTLSWT